MKSKNLKMPIVVDLNSPVLLLFDCTAVCKDSTTQRHNPIQEFNELNAN